MQALIDVNVLLAILHGGHVHNASALRWLDGRAAKSVLLVRVVQMGMLRLLTHRSIMGDSVFPASTVWDMWDTLCSDERFGYAAEPAQVDTYWRRLTADLPPGQCADTDLYLAALAQAGGWQLISFDRRFANIPGLNSQILK